MGAGASKLLIAALESIAKDDPSSFDKQVKVVKELFAARPEPSPWKATWALSGGVLGHWDMVRSWSLAGVAIGLETLKTSTASLSYDTGARKLKFHASVQSADPSHQFIFESLELRTEGEGRSIEDARSQFTPLGGRRLAEMVLKAHQKANEIALQSGQVAAGESVFAGCCS